MIVLAEAEREILVVSGSEAQSWLNGLITCDVSVVDKERGAYGFLLTKIGKIQTDLDVVLGDSGIILGTAKGTGEPTRATLDRYLVMEDAELSLGPELTCLRLLGSEAAAVGFRIRQENAKVMGFGAIDWLGMGGAAVFVQRASVDAVIAQILEWAGPGARLGDREDWNRLRIPKGFAEFGADYSSEDNPHEAGLERLAVSFTKGCYLGQEVVCMQDLRGKLKRRVVALEMPAHSAPISVGAPVLAQGVSEPAGRVTSAAAIGSQVFALARLRAPFFKEGSSQLLVEGVPAEIVARGGGE